MPQTLRGPLLFQSVLCVLFFLEPTSCLLVAPQRHPVSRLSHGSQTPSRSSSSSSSSGGSRGSTRRWISDYTTNWNNQEGLLSRWKDFSAQELEVKRYIGQKTFLKITDWEYPGQDETNPMDPETPGRTVTKSDGGIRIFEGQTLANTKVLLKEYLPGVKPLAKNEMKIMEAYLDSWEDEYGESREPPVEILLGSLVSDITFTKPKFVGRWVSRFPGVPSPDTGNTWLVYRWMGIATVDSYARAKQEAAFWDVINPKGRIVRRTDFVKRTMRGCLNALGCLHDAGIIHKSVGPNSFILSTIDERAIRSLTVSIGDLGFARLVSELDSETIQKAINFGATTPLGVTSYCAREDLYNLAYVFLDLLLSALPEGAEKQGDEKVELPATDQATLKRIVEDTCEFDVLGRFRDYVRSVEEWGLVASELDANSGAGWKFLKLMLTARLSAEENPLGQGGGGVFVMMNARGFLDHPYLKQ